MKHAVGGFSPDGAGNATTERELSMSAQMRRAGAE